jgi:hypothetical protein
MAKRISTILAEAESHPMAQLSGLSAALTWLAIAFMAACLHCFR